MAGTLSAQINTQKQLNGAAYTGGKDGYQTSIQAARKYDSVLLKMLGMGDNLGYTRHLNHKVMPMHLGDVLSQRRYFTLSADPADLGLDNDALTGPELKKMKGATVESKLKWYGNGIALNDYLKVTQLDNLMEIYVPVLYRNAKEVKDNIAGIAMYDGASKAFMATYSVSATGVPSVTLAADTTTVAAPLNMSIINSITNKMLTNTETYSIVDGSGATVTIKVPARIEPIKGARYVVQAGPNGLSDLLRDPVFKKDFVHGISATELRDNKIFDSYRFTFEEVSNFITVFSTDAAATASGEKKDNGSGTKIAKAAGDVSVKWAGDLEVAFVLGKEYGFDVKLAGQGLKVYTKTDSVADSGDVYGRLNFVTYKMAYTAKVSNSMAIYAIAYKPGSELTGSIVAPTEVNPKV